MKVLITQLFIFFAIVLIASTPPKAVPTANPLKKIYITWNDSISLTWKDFQGKPIPNSPEAAMTSSQVEYALNIKDTQHDTGYVWSVQAKFFPKLSWSHQEKQNDYILKHEQIHFAITELYGRLLRKKFSELTGKNKTKANFKATALEVMKLWALEQNTYDLETQHSLNVAKQTEWNANILMRLNELKAFATK